MDEIRSFIAIEIPPSLKSRLEELQREIRRADADIRWVRPEGIHLTLKFLGLIRKEDVEKICQAIAPVISGWEAFEVRVQGVGCFPNPRNPRVVWVGVDRGRETLSALQQDIEARMAGLSFPAEGRPFSPHLTLGRVRSSKGKVPLVQAIEKNKEVEVGTFEASHVFFFRSELKPTGAAYTKLRDFPLKKA